MVKKLNKEEVSASDIKIFLDELMPLPDSLYEDYAALCKRVTYPSGFQLIEAGNVCNHFWLLEKGVVRYYYFINNKEITTSFAQEGFLVSSLVSYITKQPSMESIELIEPSTFITISLDDLQTLYNIYPEMYALQIKVHECYFVKLSEMIRSFQSHNATERYANFVKKFPTLSQRVSLQHIASFLGITPETLSRIRAKKIAFKD